jgi:hypothetical protein
MSFNVGSPGERNKFARTLLRLVFPVPPLQQLGMMPRLGGKIDSAPEYIKNAPVHAVSHFPAEFAVKGLRIPASQICHFLDSQPTKILGDRRSDSRNAQ